MLVDEETKSWTYLLADMAVLSGEMWPAERRSLRTCTSSQPTLRFNYNRLCTWLNDIFEGHNFSIIRCWPISWHLSVKRGPQSFSSSSSQWKKCRLKKKMSFKSTFSPTPTGETQVEKVCFSCFLSLVQALVRKCWLMLLDVDWSCLMLIDADWCWLMLK